MRSFAVALLLAAAPRAVALLSLRGNAAGQSCAAQDQAHRVAVQNKLAGVCEEMCKEIGAYPKCAQCPSFVEPDATPGVLTWEELLEHMDNLVSWGQEQLKGWRAQASALQTAAIKADLADAVRRIAKAGDEEEACAAADVAIRAQVQSRLASICETMCKEVGAYPKCTGCPEGTVKKSGPSGVMSWEELLGHMENLSDWGHDQLKEWQKHLAPTSMATKRSALLQQHADGASCAAEDLARRSRVQNKLAGVCEDMCKEIGAYPKCGQCPQFVKPDSTPGVMTWEELLEHMENLDAWTQEQIKGWHAMQALLAIRSTGSSSSKGGACDAAARSMVQGRLAADCEEMCKKVGAYPDCPQCKNMAAPDKTPGVMTWDELLTHLDNLVDWGAEEVKAWHKQTSAL